MISSSTQKTKKVFFQSLGCPKNLVDTEVMLGIARKNSHEIVQSPEEAEVIVVNTCSFINDAKQESINTVLELAQQKQTGSCERLIVTGCLPQRYKADLKVSMPEVDAFVGTAQYADLQSFIEGKSEEEKGFENPRYVHSESTDRVNTQPGHRAFLKISEGCIKNCAFCIIPKIRGTLRSRSVESLVEEAKLLVKSGVKEFNLIAQDLTDYGRDLRYDNGLLRLLESLSKVDGLEWMRLLYVYPDDLSDELLSFIAEEPKVCRYLDMPVQHINDRVLDRMNRKRVTGEKIRERISRIRDLVPGLSLRSTALVGYPGETEEEFEQLLHFVKEARFNHLGVFAYSVEENTDSYQLDGHLPEDVRQERRHQLMEVQQKISHDLLQTHVGKTHRVLVEGVSEESEFFWQGRHEGQAPDIDGHILLHGGTFSPGEFREIHIERALDYDLVGQPTS